MATFSAPAAKEHVKGLRAQIVHRADQEFPFLHDTMIVPLGGRLLMAWYNCSENEIVGRTIIRGRWSADHGQTWSEPEIICEDVRPEHHMVPVTFTEENGEIWAYVTRMSSHDRPTGYVCVQYDHGQWKLRQEREELVLINTLPQETDGEWIAGGRMAAKPGELPLIPVVVRAPKQSPAPWKVAALPGPWNEGVYPLEYPETAVLVEKRPGGRHRPQRCRPRTGLPQHGRRQDLGKSVRCADAHCPRQNVRRFAAGWPSIPDLQRADGTQRPFPAGAGPEPRRRRAL